VSSPGRATRCRRPVPIHDALNGVQQVIPRGPVASEESIKQLGTNGGGFFNANGADPLENPTGLTNLLSVALMMCIPVALTYTFGKMVGSTRQGAALVAPPGPRSPRRSPRPGRTTYAGHRGRAAQRTRVTAAGPRSGRGSPQPGRAADAGHRSRASRQPVLPDGLPAPLAHPVAPGRQPG
jgi:Potassium-transporting ATPase A subunit